MAAEREIGRASCPVCASDRARLRVSAKGLAYVVCNACQCQVFSRSDRSDELLRRLHVAEAAPTPPAPPAPAPDNLPAELPAPDPEPAPRRGGWGWLGG